MQKMHVFEYKLPRQLRESLKVQEWSSRAADYGQGEAERFLGGNFFWRFRMLFPAVHNWLKISQLSILLPYSVRVVLIGMKAASLLEVHAGCILIR